MNRINEKLDKILPKIKEPQFIKNAGLSNEIGFYIFDYPPKDELIVREHISYLLKTLNKPSIDIKTIEIDLYHLILDILKSRNILDKVIIDEKNSGFDKVINKLKPLLKPDNFIKLIKEKVTDDIKLVFLTGVGKSYPLLRSHTVLNNLHDVLTDIPVIMFFPGEYDQRELRLFGKFKDDNYYRAFKLID